MSCINKSDKQYIALEKIYGDSITESIIRVMSNRKNLQDDFYIPTIIEAKEFLKKENSNKLDKIRAGLNTNPYLTEKGIRNYLQGVIAKNNGAYFVIKGFSEEMMNNFLAKKEIFEPNLKIINTIASEYPDIFEVISTSKKNTVVVNITPRVFDKEKEEDEYNLIKQLDEEEFLEGDLQTRETGNYDVVDGEIVVLTNNGFNNEYSLNNFQEEQKELDKIVTKINNESRQLDLFESFQNIITNENKPTPIDTTKSAGLLWGKMSSYESETNFQPTESKSQYRSDNSLQEKINGRDFKEIWNSNEFTQLERENILLHSIQERMFDKNTFNGELFAGINSKLGKLELRVVDNEKHPFLAFQKQIYINPKTFLKYLQNANIEDVDKYIDLTVSEELIHVLTNYFTSLEDIKKIATEINPNNFKYIQSIYKSLPSGDFELGTREYLRMIIQQEILGTTTEKIKYTKNGVIDSIIDKIWNFLYQIFKDNKGTLAEKVKKHIDFIKSNNVDSANNYKPDILQVEDSFLNQDIKYQLSKVQDTTPTQSEIEADSREEKGKRNNIVPISTKEADRLLKHLSKKYGILGVLTDLLPEFTYGKFTTEKILINKNTYYDENGDITFEPKGFVNKITIYHEYLHPFVQILERVNPELYEKIYNDSLSTDIDVSHYIKDVRKEERVVRYLDKLSAQDVVPTLLQKFLDFLSNLFFKNKKSDYRTLQKLNINTTVEELYNIFKNYGNLKEGSEKIKEERFLKLEATQLKNLIRLNAGDVESHKTELEIINQKLDLLNRYDVDKYQLSKEQSDAIDNVFDENPELADAVTKEQYREYINSLLTGETISNQAGDLSKSQVKDIVYHGTDNPNFSGFGSDFSRAIHFGTLQAAKDRRLHTDFEFKRNAKFIPVILNIKNPLKTEVDFNFEGEGLEFVDDPDFDFTKEQGHRLLITYLHNKGYNVYHPEGGVYRDGEILNNAGLDSVIYKNEREDKGNYSYAVFEPEQIHILSSKSDIEQAKEFISKKRKIGINENNRTRKSESTSTSRENDTNGGDYYLSQEFKEASENFIWSSEEGHRYNFGSLSVIQGLAGRARNIQKMVERRKERLDWDGNEIEVKSDNTSIQKYSNFSFGKIWEKMGKSGVDLEANIISSSFVVQRALQESNKFYSRIRESIEREFNISIIGEISLDIDSPPLWANTNHIAVNLYKIDLFAKKHKNYTDFIEEIDKGIEEEIIHIAINNLTTDSELLQVFDEMTEDQKQDVKKVYKKKFDYRNKEDQILMVHEFIRMIIQDKYTGKISESSNPTLLGIINKLLNKVKEWLGEPAIKTNEILNRFDNLVNKPQFNISEKSKELKALPNNQWFNRTIQPIINRFSKMFPNVRSVVISEKEIPHEVKSIVEGLDKQINSFFHKGQVYIIKERVTKDIAIEEFLHPFVNALEKDNPELFKSLLLEAKKLFPELKEEVFTKYGKVYGSIFDLNREFLTQALTKKVSEQTPEQETFFQKFKSWIKDILNRLFGEEAFTRQLSELDEQMSLTDLASILNENNTQFNFNTDTNTTYYSLSEEEVITILNKLKGENVTEKQKELTRLILNNNKETEFIADTHEYFTNNLGEKVALKPVSGFLPKLTSDKIFEDFDKIGNVIHDIVKTMNVEKLTEQQFISKYYENSSLKKFFVEEKGFPDSSAKQIISNIYSYISMIGKNSILISEVSISHLQDIDEEFKGVAGTIDLLEIKEDGSIVIHDFKSMYLNSEEKSSTNKESTAASIKFNQKKKTYELQLSLYKKLLQGIIPENKGIELQIYPIFYLAKKETIGNTIKVVFNDEPSVNIDFKEQQNYIFNAINNLDFLESIKKYKLDYNVKFANEILPTIEEPKAKKVLSKLEIDRNELLEKMTDKLKSDNSKELEREIEKTFKQVTILVKQYGNSENELNKALFKLFDPNNELKDTKNNFEVIFKSLSTLDKDDPVAFKHYLSNLVQYVNFIQEINVSLNNIKDNFLVIKSQTKTDTEKIADYRRSYLLAKSNKDRIGETLLQMKDISEDNLFKQMVRLSISNIEEIENLYYKETLPLIANTLDSYLTPELKQEVNEELTNRLNKIKYDLTLNVSESNRKILLEELELKEKEISIINDPNLISKMIKGEFGDGHWFYSNLVANINNSNYVISGTSLMMQSILKEISIIAIRTQDDLGKEFSKRELVYGVNRDQVKKMNEDLVTTTTRFFENADGTIEDLKSMTFITEVDQQVYEDLKKLEILHKNAKTDEEKEKTLKNIKDFKELHFVSKYNPKYLNILNKIDVKVSDGRNIMEIRNAIFSDINAIKISEGKEDYKEGNITEENQKALKELYRKLFNLSSSFDRNGNKKQGADLEIAEILQSRSAELEEFRKKEVDEQTWNKLKTKKIQELLPKYNNEEQVLKSEEYKLWQSFNTVISPTKEFYDERKKILEKINSILDKKEYKDVVLVGQLKDNLNQSWEKLLAISREYRDFEREVMAQDVPDGTKKAMKTLEENIDKIKSQIKVLEKSLSEQDKKALNGLWDEYNSMVEYKNSKYYEEDLENELNKYALENEIELSELKNNKSLLVDFRLNNEWYINNHVRKEKFDVASQEMITVNEPAYYYKVIIPTNSDYLEESPAMQYNSFELKDEAYNLDKDGKPNYLDVFGRLKVKSSSPYITENLPYLKLKNDLSKKAMVTKENLLKIQEYLEKWQQGANKNNLIYYQVPSKFKKAFERLSEGNLKTITQNIADNLFKMSNDEKEFGTRGVLASLSGEEMKFIPVLGKYKTDFTDQSYDVWQSLLEYGMSITKAKMFEEKLPVFDTLIDQLEKNPPTEDASKLEAIGNSLANKFNLPNITETIKGKGTNTLQAVRDEIAKGIYEEFSKELGTFMGISDVKLTNTLLGVAGTTMMLGKVANWTVNALSGNIQVLIESAGKRYFNTKDVGNAKIELGKRTKDVLEDVSKLSDKSLIGQLTDYFDPMKGEFMDELGNKFSWSKRTNVQKILFSGKIFGEWEMQMTTFIAMLKAKKVHQVIKGKEQEYKELKEKIESTNENEELKKDLLKLVNIVDLYDAFEKGIDGIPVLKEGVQFTEKELMAYSFKIQGVNKLLNGSYAKIDQTKIEKYSLGKAAFFMKKYLVPLFVQRFGEFRQDLELQDFREGHYRIFYNTLLIDLKRLGIKNISEIYAKFSKTPEEGGYTDFQKEGIRKTLTEFAIITMILVALPLLGYGDDDDDSDTAKYAQYIALKLKREVGLFTPLAATQELTSLIERPFIAVGAASNIIDLGASILKLPLNVAFGAFEDDLYYQRKTALWDEGDSKILSLALKTAGLQVAITNPEQLLQSYKYSIR